VLNPVNPRPNFPGEEEDILKFWNTKNIFKKSIESRPKNKTFSFYDGPPYATGLPHYGHLVAGTIKDVIPRYKTMKGYRVERVWGWDTHGLPIENIVEQELNIKSKLQIREYGIDKFNEKARAKVLEYAHAWEHIVERTGRWVDMENAYITMDSKYMESVWWVFKSIWDKGLVYMGHKVMPYCPRCATGLSSFEVGLGGYKDKIDKTVTVKFQSEDDPNTYFLAWTTTPWTLPGNLALAVNPNIKYVKVKRYDKFYILAKDRLEHYKNVIGDEIVEEFNAKKLIGKKYKRIFDYYKGVDKAFEIIAGDYVTTEDGTGIVHIAPAFGEEDYRVAKESGIAFYMPVNDMGEFEIDVPDYAGLSVVSSDTNARIITELGDKALVVRDHTHPYPYCWRCDSPLIYKAIDSWFVATEKLKKQMIKNNESVHWVPDHIGKGRFAKLLEGAPDWNISRNRFWGVPIPVWACEKCNENKVMGSIKELEEATGKKIDDIHLHKIHDLKVKCKCGGDARLTGEVLDVWFDSGCMPYASIHYPFENKDKFERDFPADFIAEGVDQTRGWFNSLMVLGTALFGKSPYKNVVVNGIVLAEDGQKMAKRLKNYPDPSYVMEKYGADAMRFYLMSSPAVKAGDLNFSEKGVEEIVKRLILTYWNSYSFFVTYASIVGFKPEEIETEDILDLWVISRLNNTVNMVTEELDNYELPPAARAIEEFVGDLSNWYIRRNRKRFAAGDKAALNTLYGVLVKLSQMLAPYMPFVTEEVYQNLVVNFVSDAKESIHLTDFPVYNELKVDDELEDNMEMVRKLVEMGMSIRNEKGIKVRQPLSVINATINNNLLDKRLQNILLEELNVKGFADRIKSKNSEESSARVNSKELKLIVDLEITSELKAEGLAREILRKVQVLRKEKGLSIDDKIELYYETEDNALRNAINHPVFKEGAKVKTTKEGKIEDAHSKELAIEGSMIWVGIKKA